MHILSSSLPLAGLQVGMLLCLSFTKLKSHLKGNMQNVLTFKNFTDNLYTKMTFIPLTILGGFNMVIGRWAK